MPEPLAPNWRNRVLEAVHAPEVVRVPVVYRQEIIEVLKQLDGLKRTLHKLLNA